MQLQTIGKVSAEKGQFQLKLDTPYKEGLLELQHFNYIHVLWWADECDDAASRRTLQTDLPYAKDTKAGVFACRSPYRPNPIALSLCPVLSIDMEKGIITIAYIDAHDGTQLLDIKPYIAVSDRVKAVTTAPWFAHWPEFYEDASEFFSKPENQYFND